MTIRTLLQIEVGGIQSYVFEGGRLRDYRGASALLDALNRVRLPDLAGRLLPDAQLLRASGSVTLLGLPEGTPDGDVDQFVDAARRAYRTEAPGAAVYASRVAVADGEGADVALRRLSFAAAIARGDCPETDPGASLLGSLVRPCSSCGRRPAETERRLGGTAEVVCLACAARGEAGLRVRRGNLPGGLFDRFAAAVREDPSWGARGAAEALGDSLSDLDPVGGDVALVVADGNGLGEVLRHITSFEGYRAFSVDLASAVERAVFRVLAGHPARGGALPWEPVFLGGDDIVLALAPDIALRVVLDVCEAVERETAPVISAVGAPGRDRLTLAAGVAVAPAHTPFRTLHALALQLEGSAKRAAYALRSDGREQSTVDFHRVTGTGHVSLTHVRAVESRPERPTPGDGAERPVLTERPYAAPTLRRVVEVGEAWAEAGLPSSKRHGLRAALLESPTESMFAWAHTVGRARNDDERAVWLRLHELDDRPPQLTAPWVPDADGRPLRTHLLDVLDVVDLVR